MRETKARILDGIEHLVAKAKCIDNNTYEVLYTNGDKSIRLHHTDVITVKPNGDVVLDSGGYRTPTTKHRINRYSDLKIMQRDYIWYVGTHYSVWKPKSPMFTMVEFYDGIIFSKEGKVKCEKR
jgi:hypothetical protein